MMDAARQARCDFAGIPPARVREVLALAAVPIAVAVSRAAGALRHCGSIDADDLRAVGQIAALEAEQTYTPGRGASLRSWIGTCVRWRIAELVQGAYSSASHESSRGLVGDYEALMDSYEPSEAYDLAQAREWVLRSLVGLSPRQKILLAQRLGNSDETIEELAASLGVDRTQVWRDLSSAIEVLRQRVGRDLARAEEAPCV